MKIVEAGIRRVNPTRGGCLKRPPLTGFCHAVPAGHHRGDPQQPGQRRFALQIKRSTPLEGDEEGLAQDVLPRRVSHPPIGKRPHRPRMSIEETGEGLRLSDRPSDDLAVCAHTMYSLNRVCEFTVS